ncbi:Gfo/Idh/MocA family protein [Propionibacteriaceae bacterium Y1685]
MSTTTATAPATGADQTTDQVRFGVIGVGIIGKQHVKRLVSGVAPTSLVAVADANPEAAQALAAEFEVEAAESVEALLARDDIDAIVIAVPSGLHADLAVAALDAGKHVLLEKPIDVTVEAADRIIEAEKRSGKVLSVVSQRRFAQENAWLREAIRNGTFGKVCATTVEIALWRTQEYYDSAGWRGTWAMDGGGALMNQGVHLVDMALWLLGDVENVYAEGGLLAHERIEVEDTIAITARLKSGGVLNFLATTCANAKLPLRVNVMGTEGVAVSSNEEFSYFVTSTDAELPEFEKVDQQAGQLNNFVEAVRTGGTPLVTSAESRAAVAFIEAAYESMRTGKAVTPR